MILFCFSFGIMFFYQYIIYKTIWIKDSIISLTGGDIFHDGNRYNMRTDMSADHTADS